MILATRLERKVSKLNGHIQCKTSLVQVTFCINTKQTSEDHTGPLGKTGLLPIT